MRKLLIILLLATIGYSYGQQTKVSTSLTADTIWIGDQVLLQVDIEKDMATEVGLPEFKDGKLTDKIELVGEPMFDTLSKDGRNVKLRISYSITVFDAGNYYLQGFPFVIHNANGSVDTLKSSTVNSLYVKTFDIDTAKQEIFDIKEPLNTPLIFAEVKDLVIWSGVGAIILAVILYFLIRWYKSRKRAILSRPKEPAHIIALKALEALQSKKIWQSGNVKEYYSILSEILRDYIENRYDIAAMEMTSDEIMESLKEVNSGKLIEHLKDFLSTSDLVKFAKWHPNSEENDQSWHTIYNYIEQTKLLITSNEEEHSK